MTLERATEILFNLDNLRRAAAAAEEAWFDAVALRRAGGADNTEATLVAFEDAQEAYNLAFNAGETLIAKDRIRRSLA